MCIVINGYSRGHLCCGQCVSVLLPAQAVALLQSAVSPWTVPFLVVSAACEGQHVLVHTVYVNPAFPLHDVTAHPDDNNTVGLSHSADFGIWFVLEMCSRCY